MKSPSMPFCSFVSGDTDFIIMLHVQSLQSYNGIYRNELSVLPYVAKIRSSLALKEVSRSASCKGRSTGEHNYPVQFAGLRPAANRPTTLSTAAPAR